MYYARAGLSFFGGLIIIMALGLATVAETRDVPAKQLRENCKRGDVEACHRLASRASDEPVRALWLWLGCESASQNKSIRAMESCVSLASRPDDWARYRARVEVLFRNLCTQADAAGACISLGSLARRGAFDRLATTRFLKSECNKKNGGGCYGLFSSLLTEKSGDEIAFSIPEPAIGWIKKACDLNYSDSCEVLGRTQRNPSHFQFYPTDPKSP